MGQPVPKVSIADVERIVSRDYPLASRAEIIDLIRPLGSPRVQLAVLKLAGGFVQKLPNIVESAKRDYRDVLVGAEYGRYWKGSHRLMEKMSAAELDQAIQEDWEEYQEWLKRMRWPREESVGPSLRSYYDFARTMY